MTVQRNEIKRKLKWYIFLTAILLLAACGKSDEQQLIEQLELGQKYLTEQNYEEAIVTFNKAIELEPKTVEAYIGLINAYILLGEYEKAVVVYEECSSVFISSETQNLDQIKISLIGQLKEAAMTLMEEGEYWRAETIYNLMLKVEEDASDVILGLVESMLSQNKFEEAEKCLAEGLERNPKAEELREKEEEFRQGEIRDYRDRILKSTWYKEDGNISSYTISEYNDKDGSSKTTFYDSKGNMKNEEYTFYENNGKKRKVRYDATGYLMSESGYTEEGIWRTIAYNEDGTVKYIEDQMDSGERKTYDSDGNLKFYTVREYDEAGRCIKWSEYSSDDELRGYWVSEYDDQGNRISYRQYNPDGTLDAYLEAE